MVETILYLALISGPKTMVDASTPCFLICVKYNNVVVEAFVYFGRLLIWC